MKKKLHIFTAILFVSAFAKAQVSFSDGSSLLVNETLNSGVAMAITDMNDDGLDDIIRLDNATSIEIELQQSSGGFGLLPTVANLNDEAWGMTIADVDQNGLNDIIVGGFYDGLTLITIDNGGGTVTETALGGPDIFLQNANFADIDNDGNIDFFGCHDDGLASPYRNNGSGSFTYDTGLINAESTVSSDNSGNYGSIWTDYDNDGDLDLYISKCRQGVDNPMDGRRLNLLFQNDGNNNFTDVAEAAGLRPMRQTWSSNFEDIDNDGDFDVVMVNHFENHQIFENNGDGTFTDITSSTGIENDLLNVDFGIQVMMEDFNNDTFIDIIMTTTSGDDRLFLNDGDMTFTSFANVFPTTGGATIQSGALGDLNNDGFIDMIAGYANGFNNPSSVNDQLFINDGNDNNWSKIKLTGVESNINGIGARIEIYGDWGVQVREVRAGESYGTQNSLIGHFGLADATEIETIVVKWPSGIEDTIENPNINETLTVVEGEGNLSVNDVTTTDVFTLFPNPATSTINFNLTNTSIGSKVLVYDILGRQVIDQEIKTIGEQSIDITRLNAGVYFVSVADTVQKFIKN